MKFIGGASKLKFRDLLRTDPIHIFTVKSLSSDDGGSKESVKSLLEIGYNHR